MDFTNTNYSFEQELPKLIRDKIPAIIEKKEGQKANFRIAENDEEYLNFLLKKLVEEAQETQKSPAHNNTQEELADVFEVIYAILSLKGWTIEEIINIQKQKRGKNGGFEKRYILLEK